MRDIDFVITWAGMDDGERTEYIRNCNDDNSDARDCRYRDWQFLKYWFRSIEKNADFYRYIYFVVKDDVPEWLDISNPKLKVIRHSDIIDSRYLPTFNNTTIEFNLANIKGLSEYFVYFNDDVFVNRPLTPENFFKSGLPVYSFGIRETSQDDSVISNILRNTVAVINQNFKLSDTFKENGRKLLDLKNGVKTCFRTILTLCGCRNRFPGFKNDHVMMPMLKSVFEEILEKEKDRITGNWQKKFRDKADLSVTIVLIWECLQGKFVPVSSCDSKYYFISDNSINAVVEEIRSRNHARICLNDGPDVTDFEMAKKMILEAFEAVYPEKSSFEK